jgi:hypothetical protein
MKWESFWPNYIDKYGYYYDLYDKYNKSEWIKLWEQLLHFTNADIKWELRWSIFAKALSTLPVKEWQNWKMIQWIRNAYSWENWSIYRVKNISELNIKDIETSNNDQWREIEWNEKYMNEMISKWYDGVRVMDSAKWEYEHPTIFIFNSAKNKPKFEKINNKQLEEIYNKAHNK